jgi:hypothetical protein
METSDIIRRMQAEIDSLNAALIAKDAEITRLTACVIQRHAAIAGEMMESARKDVGEPIPGSAHAEGIRARNAANKFLEAYPDAQHVAAEQVTPLAFECALDHMNDLLASLRVPGEVDIRSAALEEARQFIEQSAQQHGYGFARPANPHDFHPDGDSCSAEEIAAHKAACEAFDKGEYTPEKGSEWVGAWHILRAPWGIGSYTYLDQQAEELIGKIDAALATPPSKVQGAEPQRLSMSHFATMDDYRAAVAAHPRPYRTERQEAN